MKKLEKKEIGGPRTKTVSKSPSGNYKTITKIYNNDNTTGETTTVRRTLKGVLSGAPKVSATKIARSDEKRAESKEKAQEYAKNYQAVLEGDYKKGGSVKSKTKTKTKK